jgi:hypothetical protein
MAFKTLLQAIKWTSTGYETLSRIEASVDLDALERENRFVNVSDDPGYADFSAVLAVKEFPKYFLPESNPWAQAARTWCGSIPKGAHFIVVTKAEWESGILD